MSTHCPMHWEEGHSDYCTILGKGVPSGEKQALIDLCLAIVAVGVGVCACEQRPLGAQDAAHPSALAWREMLRGGLLP